MPLRDYAAARGYEISETYRDVGISGSKERRPGLDKLMTDARRHKFNVLLVARFDRFARSTRHLLTALAEFEQLGIDFISLNESVDTSTPMGRMVFTILAAVGELERELIRERVQAGVDRARRQGKRLGRPRILVDEQRVIEMLMAGESVRAVAAAVGVSRPTIDTIRKKHAGKSGKKHAESPSPDCVVST